MTARPVPDRPIPERVVVVGCAGSGKTTLARELAVRLACQGAAGPVPGVEVGMQSLVTRARDRRAKTQPVP